MDWRMTLAQVDVEVAAGRYVTADRLLLDFQQQHPGSREIPDATVRRALYMLDPLNTAASPADARALLDSLLAGPVEGTRRNDALVLKRVSTALEARAVAVRPAAPSGGAPGAAAPAGALSASEAKAKDDEIAKLKDDLARTTAELERIRRRIATPKP